MQKTPMYRSSRTVIALMAAASALPTVITSAHAGEGGGLSGLAEREIARRQSAVQDGDRLLTEGREAYAQGDYQKAFDKYSEAVGKVPDAPMFADRRQSYLAHMADAGVALSMQFRKVGKYTEARTLLESVLAKDPENAAAKRELGYLDDPIRTNPALDYEHTQKIDEVRRTLYTAEGNVNLGKFDAAKKDYEKVLRLDPYNSAARRGMEQLAATKSAYYRAAYDHTRAELLMQVDQAWELAVPSEAPAEIATRDTGPRESSGVAYITEKLRRIIIPKVDFEDTTVEEAINFLRMRSVELDTLELDPGQKGVNFVVRRPRSAPLGGAAPAEGGAAGEGAGDALPAAGGGDPSNVKIPELRLRNMPLAQVLKYICETTKLRYKVDDFAVTLVPQTETVDDLYTRTFRVAPNFQSELAAGAGGATGGGAEADPFGTPSAGGGAKIEPKKPIKDLLKLSGVNFPEGSSASLTANGALIVTNTPSELDKVETVVEASSNKTPKQVKITTKFVEISQENSEELGFDWILSPYGMGDVFATGGTTGNGAPRSGNDISGPSIPGEPLLGNVGNVDNMMTNGNRSGDYANQRNSIDAILNNPNRTGQQSNVAPGILSLTGLFTDGQVKMIMRGLSQKKGTDLMTAPSVTARSGQKATIEIIREFIYPTEYEPPQIPTSVGGNGNNGGIGGIGGGGGGGTTPVTPANPTAFETRNTGVTMEIEPTIGENDFMIDLRFIPEIVEFEGFINYGSPIQTQGSTSILDDLGNVIRNEPTTITLTENRIEMPVFSTRRVNTQLTIYDGYTVAVGGLMREDVQNVEDKVPILGDIPLIGRLFQTKAENRIKSNLIIFVTAQIIDATGRPLRGVDSAGSMPVTTTGAPAGEGGGVLPRMDLPQ